MLVQILLLIAGLVLLIKGADWLVNGASSLAKKYNVSDLAIGLTIVAFGTSAPELVVNTIASFQNHQEIVMGNVIGSNNFNLFLILGISGLIIPLTVQSSTVWKEIPISFAGTIILYILCNDFFSEENTLSRMDGVILLGLFGLFLFYVYKQLKTDSEKPGEISKKRPALQLWGLIVIGLAGLVFGGRLVVTNAVEMATALGVSENIVGLTIVAAGTSLPELATSVVAAIKKNNDIAVGNIIGSNIFNIFFILSVSAFVRPIPYDELFNRDMYLLAGGTIFLFAAMFFGRKKTLARWEAAVMMLTYLAYTAYLIAGIS